MSDDVVLAGVTKRFGARTVLDSVDVTVRRAQVLALLGPSGSGKSTLLRVVAGLESVDAGTVHIGRELVSSVDALVPPERRRVGFVFQSFALFPHLTAEDNVAFGTRDRQRVDELLALVGLTPRRAARVDTLSGGEQQRVALARALAIEPRVVLLDEPFANLDAALRRQLRDGVASALRAREATAILVTHDASEAFALADHVAVISDGRILQHGTPEDVYARPRSLDVASRTGDTVTLAGRTSRAGFVTTTLGELASSGPDEGDVTVCVRPEQLVIGGEGVPARVARRTFEGASTALELAIGDERFTARGAGLIAASVDETVRVEVRGSVRTYARATAS